MEAAKQKVGRPAEIDYTSLLYDLYRYRTLTVDQMRRLHFKGYESSIYVILGRLKKRGWVNSTCMVNQKGKKIAACYYVTQRGLTDLVSEGKVRNPRRRAYDNKPETKKIPYLVDTNELYIELSPCGFEMIDGREWKEIHISNRNALVKAGLSTSDGSIWCISI